MMWLWRGSWGWARMCPGSMLTQEEGLAPWEKAQAGMRELREAAINSRSISERPVIACQPRRTGMGCSRARRDTHVHTHEQRRACPYTHTHTQRCVFRHTEVRKRTHKKLRVRTHTQRHTFPYKHAKTHIFIDAFIHTRKYSHVHTHRQRHAGPCASTKTSMSTHTP